MLAGGVVPYRPGVSNGPEPTRLFVGVLEVMWWLSAAWLAVGFFACVRRAGATAARHEIGSGPLGRAHLPCGAASLSIRQGYTYTASLTSNVNSSASAEELLEAAMAEAFIISGYVG
jgi:hypothetical protein